MSVKTDLKIETNHVLIVAGVGIAAYLVYRGYKKAGETAAAVVDKVNPASPENFIYQGVNSIGSAVTGDKHFSLGSWIYDKIHGDPLVKNQAVGTVAAGDRLIKIENHEGISE